MNLDEKVGSLAKLIGGKFKRLIKSNEEIGTVWGMEFEIKENGKKLTKIMWILSDDEGNAPGSWDIQGVAQ